MEQRPSRPLRQLKPQAEQLVVKWVTISESCLLIVFDFFWPFFGFFTRSLAGGDGVEEDAGLGGARGE